MSDLTFAELDALFEASKDDRTIIVGSDVRRLIGEIRRRRSATTDLAQEWRRESDYLASQGDEAAAGAHDRCATALLARRGDASHDE